MFKLKDFILKGLLDAIGKMGDYQVILNAAGWYEKGVLDDACMMELQTAIEAQYIVVEAPTEEDILGVV